MTTLEDAGPMVTPPPPYVPRTREGREFRFVLGMQCLRPGDSLVVACDDAEGGRETLGVTGVTELGPFFTVACGERRFSARTGHEVYPVLATLFSLLVDEPPPWVLGVARGGEPVVWR